ncbi:hypothetical protein FKM82_027673 [Ascaphus truei]
MCRVLKLQYIYKELLQPAQRLRRSRPWKATIQPQSPSTDHLYCVFENKCPYSVVMPT